MSIEPLTELQHGTKVTTDNKFGTVIKCNHSKDQFNQPINNHTVHFTKQFVCKTIRGRKYKNIDIISDCNYAGINVFNWNI